MAPGGDGRLVTSGDGDATVRLWDASSGALRREPRVERRYEALDMTGLTGTTDAQRATLLALGAIGHDAHAAPSDCTLTGHI